MSDTFKCSWCGGEFEKGWSDEEAIAEAIASGFDPAECNVVICSECYDFCMGQDPERPSA